MNINALKILATSLVLLSTVQTSALAQPADEPAPAADEAAVDVNAQLAGPATEEKLVIAYKANLWTRAIDIANELIKTDPENPKILNILAVSLAQSEKYDEAIPIFEKLKEIQPDDAQTYINLCLAKDKHNHTDINICKEAIQRNPDNANLHYVVGGMLENAKRIDEALEQYEAAYKLEHDNIMYLTAVTSIHFAQKNYQKALELTEQAIQNGEEKAILYLNIINAANRIGEYSKAIEYADKGFEKFHDSLMPIGKAEALYKLGKFDEAETLWVELEKTTAPNSLGRAKVEYGLGRTYLANACTTELYKTCSTDTPAPCCQKEIDALKFIQSAKNGIGMSLEDQYPAYLGLAQILNNQVEEAEKLLTFYISANSTTDKSAFQAAMAVNMYQFSDPTDRAIGRRFYYDAIAGSEDFKDIERIRVTRGWPLRLLDTYKGIQDEIDQKNARKEARKACSCELMGTSSPTVPFTALILSFFTILGTLILRRKSA